MDIVFGTKWFEDKQRVLLWLLNTPIIRVWFRYCLRIDNKQTINRILPNSYTFGGKYVGEDLVELTTDFRTHDKYSKRLYFAFKPFWYLLHFFDWALLDRVEALTKLSFGFSTLTVYPDADAETTTVDGGVRQTYSETPWATWATIRAAAGNSAYPTDNLASGGFYTDTSATAAYKQLRRLIFLFDTSTLTAGATISASVYSVYGTAKTVSWASPGTSFGVGLVSSAPASNTAIVAGDYDSLGATRFATDIAYGSYSTTGYNDFTLNASGLAAISKTGITKFGLRQTCDIDNAEPASEAGVDVSMDMYFADEAGTTSDPKLVVTYSTVVGPANVKTYQGIASASTKTLQGVAMASVKSSQGII